MQPPLLVREPSDLQGCLSHCVLTAQAEVKVSFDFAKGKYKESLQQLIDDFGFHPAFKRWFDEF